MVYKLALLKLKWEELFHMGLMNSLQGAGWRPSVARAPFRPSRCLLSRYGGPATLFGGGAAGDGQGRTRNFWIVAMRELGCIRLRWVRLAAVLVLPPGMRGFIHERWRLRKYNGGGIGCRGESWF